MTTTTHDHPDVDVDVNVHDPSLAGARAWFAQKRLTRPRDDRMLAGVSAGFARRYDVNPLVVRLLTIATIAILTPLAYLAAWILMPDDAPAEPVAAVAA